ncbi:hypothetical protein WJR50_12590 [Catalinimonas sp. 4WD22]|uniref:hypothetical protein n=1 Tax=Catalinimonas locisalis TaxID=3133978 RepID=UPI0031010504
MMRRKTYIILCLCIFAINAGLSAQALTEFDKNQIVRRARLRIQEFEELLQLISDPTRSRGAIDRYIVSSYSRKDSLFNQVFYDDQVIIEDDLTPIDLTQDNIEVSALPVTTYLNNFKLQYQKYYEKTIFFTELEFSEVQEEDFIYVIASYNSEFKGKHASYKNYQYKPIRRKATLRAEYDLTEDRWKVWIAGVNYDRTQPQLQATENNAASDRQDSLAITEEEVLIPTDTVQEKQEPVLSQVQEEEASSEEKIPQLAFTSRPPAGIKKGENIAFNWNTPLNDATLTLYQGNDKIADIRRGLDGQKWNWKVQQKPGKNYSVTLYDPATDRKAESGLFRIKSRFPLALKIGIPLAAVGIIAVISSQDNGGGGGNGGGGETDSSKIDITPTVPSGGN